MTRPPLPCCGCDTIVLGGVGVGVVVETGLTSALPAGSCSPKARVALAAEGPVRVHATALPTAGPRVQALVHI